MAHLLESLEESPLWTDFFDILSEFNNEHVLNQARALAALRVIDSESSDEVVRESIRDLGINLPNEILDINLEKLRNFFYHLPNFEESLGNPKYQDFIGFLLDSGFEVVPLWTADFKTFSEEPGGTKLEDGGEWYKTSHVKILPQWGKLQNAFDLEIDPELERQLISSGVVAESPNSIVGKNAEDLGQEVLQAVLEYKVIDLFFRFAPIELVLERLIYTIKIEADLYFSGHVFYEQKDYLNLTKENLTKVVFPRPKKVFAARPIVLYATAFYENNVQTQVPVSFDILEGAEHIDQISPASIIFKDPTNTVPLKLKFKALGRSAEHVMLLMPSTSAETPKSIEIKIKDELEENQSYPLKVFGEFETTRTIDDIDQVEWSVSSDSVEIVDNVLYVGRIHADEEVTITAEYWDQYNKYHKVEKVITILDTLKEAVPVRMRIDSADNITQGNTGQLRCLVDYSDETTVQVDPLWECANNHVTIEPNGLIGCEKVQADFSSVIKSSLTVDGVTLSAEKKIKFIFERLVIFNTKIVGNNSMIEKTSQQLSCLAYWCFAEDLQDYIDGNKTAEEILVGETDVNVNWSLGATTSNLGIKLNQGYIEVPSTNHQATAVVNATVTQVDGNPITTSMVITISPEEDLISHIDLVCSPDIYQDSIYPVRPIAVFNSGKSVEINEVANASASFDIVTENDTAQDRANLYMIDNKIYFFGNVSGLVKLKCVVDYTHTLSDGSSHTQTVSSDRLLSVIPKVVKTNGIEVIIPSTNVLPDGMWFVTEESRMFLKTNVFFEDGTVRTLMPNWINELVIPEDSEYDTPIELVNMKINLRDMVEILTGFSAEEVYMTMAKHIYGHNDSELVGNILSYKDNAGTQFQIDLTKATDWSILSNMAELSGYPEFSDISLSSDLLAEENRTLVQCSRVNEDTEVMLQTIYGKEKVEHEITVLNREEVNPNTILSSAVRGPVEFLANVESVSYALYINFDDGGPEYAVSNDWEIKLNNKRAVLDALEWEHSGLTDEELDLKYPDRLIIEIDQDGYVYPKHNEQIEFTVTALYDDDFDKFSKSMDAVAYRANLELKGIEIVGPDTVQDINDPSLVNEGVPHIPYTARLHLTNGEVEDVVAEWKIRLDQANLNGDPDGIMVDASTGKLYVNEQILDQHVVLDVYYERQYDSHLESVKAQLPVMVVATRSITGIEITGPASTVDDSTVQLTVTATRANGNTSDVTALCDWFVLDANQETKVEDGQVVLGKFATDKQVYIGATLRQGSNTLEASYDFEVKGQSSLNGLSISGMTNIRDDSDVQLEAIVFRGTEVVTPFYRAEPEVCGSYECVTNECYWKILQGSDIARIDKGMLRVKHSTESKAVKVRATFIERGVTVSADYDIFINSSMPRYGVADENFDILQVMDFETVDSPEVGGSFAINVDTTEPINVKGFFAHRKDLGVAHIVEARGRTGYGSWSGAIEIAIAYDNVTTEYLVYYTTENNFGIGEFAYYYKSQNS